MIPAVSYLRMSTDKQDKSIADQRSEVLDLAKKHRFKIVREYVDEGISGDDTEKRIQFKKMIADARERGDFQIILCWDQDRFGRFDSLEAGFWITPLRNAGVRLVTTAQGEIDWEDFTGRVMYGLQQEGKNQYLIDLSRNIVRSQKQLLERGSRPCGAVPFGFDKIYVDAGGREVGRKEFNGPPIAKRREWITKLALANDGVAVETVRRIFREFNTRDISTRTVARELNRDSVPTPGGKLWCFAGVYRVLTNPIYCGDFVYGRRVRGKYHTCTHGEIKRVTRETRCRARPREECTVIENSCPAIVSRDVWERAQERLFERKQRSISVERFNKYPLAGLLICGNCGKRLRGRADVNGKGHRYGCRQHSRFTEASDCKCWTVSQSWLMGWLMKILDECIFGVGRREQLEAAIRKSLKGRASRGSTAGENLKARVAALDLKITRGVKRLMNSPNDISDLLGPEISAWRGERSKLARQISDSKVSTQADAVDSQVKTILDNLESQRSEFETAPPDRLRELLRRFIARAELWWDGVSPAGKRPRWWLAKMVITLQSDVVLRLSPVIASFQGKLRHYSPPVRSTAQLVPCIAHRLIRQDAREPTRSVLPLSDRFACDQQDSVQCSIRWRSCLSTLAAGLKLCQQN